MSPIIRIENLGKKYRLGETHANSLRDLVNATARRWFSSSTKSTQKQDRFDDEGDFWALKDVSFEIHPGEVVGIIGRNGAGKSTLLKILSNIVAPTTGRIELYGRVASLLEVGTGFHPELTGRENVFLNGTILGMTKAQVRQRFDEIVAFSEIEKHIDTPVKRYSSGMYVRLAFSVAAHLDPDILIVDEVLAVGDIAFQKKCMGTLGASASQGRTVLFVSHNLQAVSQLTSRCVLIDNGTVICDDNTYPALQRFRELLSPAELSQAGKYNRTKPITDNCITTATVHTSSPHSMHAFGRTLTITFTIHIEQPRNSLCFSFQIANADDDPITYTWLPENKNTLRATAGTHTITCTLPDIPLYMGDYSLKTYLSDRLTHEMHEHLNNICNFSVTMDGEPAIDYPWHPDAATFLPQCNWS